MASAFSRPSERGGQDHLAEIVDVVEEHVLGAAQADPLGTEGDRLAGLLRLVGVGAHGQPAMVVDPAHQLLVAVIDLGLLGRQGFGDQHLQDFAGPGFDRAFEDFAGEAVDRNRVAGLERLAFDGDGAGVIVDVQLAAADDAGLAHLAADQGRVRAGAAEGGENALGDLHAAQVFGAGLAADEDQLDVVVLEPFVLRRRRRGSRSCPRRRPGRR